MTASNLKSNEQILDFSISGKDPPYSGEMKIAYFLTMLKKRAFQVLVCRGGPPAGGENIFIYIFLEKKDNVMINVLQEFNPTYSLDTTSKDLKTFNR